LRFNTSAKTQCPGLQKTQLRVDVAVSLNFRGFKSRTLSIQFSLHAIFPGIRNHKMNFATLFFQLRILMILYWYYYYYYYWQPNFN
jgi:hypothetical protein